jgi:predicted DNA-binding protein
MRNGGTGKMPKGKPNPQTIASEKYQKKAGYKTKAFKLKGDVAERFQETCEKLGKSQASVITDLMEKFISDNQ